MADKNTKVLIVDDSAAVRRAVALMLASQPYECLEANDGAEALGVLGDHDIACVISDLHMPKLDGLAFLEEMRRLPKYRFTPFLILTTDRVDENKAALRSAGATGVLSKPIEAAALIDAVRRAIKG